MDMDCCSGTTVLNVFAYRGIELKVTPMIRATGIIWVTLLAASILGERPQRENDSFYCDHSHWYHRIFVVGLWVS